jgi:hypothetical protein
MPPLELLLYLLYRLLQWWAASLQHVPAAVPAVLCTVLLVFQQLQRCSAQLLGVAAGPAGSEGFFNVPCAVEMVVCCLYAPPKDSGVAAYLLGLHREAAVAEMQLQVLAAWTAEMYKDHVAHQQQQQLLLREELHVANRREQQLQQQAQQPLWTAAAAAAAGAAAAAVAKAALQAAVARGPAVHPCLSPGHAAAASWWTGLPGCCWACCVQ